MEIKDCQPNQGKIEVVAEVVHKEEPRTFSKFGKKGKVCSVRIQDASGEILLTLWNEDIEKVNVGDTLKLDNCWCSEFKGEKQLSTGKFGKIEVMQKSEEKTIFTNDPAAFAREPGEQEGQPSAEGEEGGEEDGSVDVEEFIEE